MARAGLTRGAFYAHFKSKQALMAEVMRHEHPVLFMLRGRTGADGPALWAEMVQIFDDYLDPANLDEVHRGCSLAALTGATALAAAPVRQGYEAAWADVIAEMGRGQVGVAPDQLRAALTLATGAVTTAAACASPEHRAAVLGAARTGFHHLLKERPTA